MKSVLKFLLQRLHLYIPYFIFIVNNPCCPRNISFINENSPNHTTGVISTPNAGGTVPRSNLNSGSVGQTTTLNGTSLTFAVGYHDRTIRQSMANEKKLRNGPNTFDRGPTQASVSDRTMDDDAIILMALAADASLFSEIWSSSSSIIVESEDNGNARRAVGVLVIVGSDVVIVVGTMGLAEAADENDNDVRRAATGGVKLMHDDAKRTSVTTATCIADCGISTKDALNVQDRSFVPSLQQRANTLC